MAGEGEPVQSDGREARLERRQYSLEYVAFVAGHLALTPNPSPSALGEGSGTARGPRSIIADFR